MRIYDQPELQTLPARITFSGLDAVAFAKVWRRYQGRDRALGLVGAGSLWLSLNQPGEWAMRHRVAVKDCLQVEPPGSYPAYVEWQEDRDGPYLVVGSEDQPDRLFLRFTPEPANHSDPDFRPMEAGVYFHPQNGLRREVLEDLLWFALSRGEDARIEVREGPSSELWNEIAAAFLREDHPDPRRAAVLL